MRDPADFYEQIGSVIARHDRGELDAGAAYTAMWDLVSARLHDVSAERDALAAERDELRAKVAAVEAVCDEWYAERGAAAGHPVTDEGRGFASASRLCADEVRAALAAAAQPREDER